MRVFVLAELYEKMIAANRTENSVKRMLSLKRILHDLPTHHFDTFHYLAEHLHRVQLHSDKNKMDVHNIAIVFGPTLIRPKGESIASLVQHMADQCRIVESIVSFVRHSRLCKSSQWFVDLLVVVVGLQPAWFFSSWEEDKNVPVDETVRDPLPISSVDRQLIDRVQTMRE